MGDKLAIDLGAQPLRTDEHRRDVLGMTYVYPVLSRRAGGVSLGVNLNTNNACNWRCVYCQVDGLQRGAAPPVDVDLLRRELDDCLGRRGELMPMDASGGTAPIVDVAIAGNGEPTSAAAFAEVVAVIDGALQRHGLSGAVIMRLITNGSLIRRPVVREGLRRLGATGGEVWYKLDGGSPAQRRRVNSAAISTEAVVAGLRQTSALCRTWVQTCAFAWGERIPLLDDLPAYLDILRRVGPERLAGVHLYGIARASHQPEASMLRRLDSSELSAIADGIRRLDIDVRVSP
jgi:wyosine [tRNA(Phe)-imidazoG37] synthetase (radical SAM superfamily)